MPGRVCNRASACQQVVRRTRALPSVSRRRWSLACEPQNGVGNLQGKFLPRQHASQMGTVAAPGAARYLARHSEDWLPNLGLRPSHLGLMLDRYTHGARAKGGGRRRLAQLMTSALPRFSHGQLLLATALAARYRLSSYSIALAQLRKPRHADALRRHPKRASLLVQELAAASHEGRDASALTAMQHIANQLTEHVGDFGTHALPVFCSLAKAGGPAVFRRLTNEQTERLMSAIANQANCFAEHVDRVDQEMSSSGGWVATPHPLNDVVAAADLFCASGRTRLLVPLCSTLARSLSEHLEKLPSSRLSSLAFSLGRGNPHEEFVLLHGLCRRSIDVFEELDDASLVLLMQACAKFDMYDEEFIDRVNERLCRGGAENLVASRLADVIYALGTLQVRDPVLLDALCAALIPKTSNLTEPDLVRCLRGLMRLRHAHRGLLTALVPEIDRQKWRLGSLSLSNVISAVANLSANVDTETDEREPILSEDFFRGLLGVATNHVEKAQLTSTSVQHVLTGICRVQGRMRNAAFEEPLDAICRYMATPQVAAQMTPVQAIGALSALAKLRCRHLPAASVLISALVGRGSDVMWYWAPSATFYACSGLGVQKRMNSVAIDDATTPPPSEGCSGIASSFDEENAANFLKTNSMDAGRCVEILHGLHRLELHGGMSLRLCRMLWEQFLQPQLHDMRAREVITVARALGATYYCIDGPNEETWKETVAKSCMEGLRRHEHYLESSWFTLLPFKLLCLEIDTGTYGCRRLSDILNPALLGFVQRLRSLSYEECEQNRLQREGVDDESADVEGTAVSVSRTGSSTVSLEQVVQSTSASPRVTTAYLADGLSIDVLIQAAAAPM